MRFLSFFGLLLILGSIPIARADDDLWDHDRDVRMHAQALRARVSKEVGADINQPSRALLEHMKDIYAAIGPHISAPYAEAYAQSRAFLDDAEGLSYKNFMGAAYAAIFMQFEEVCCILGFETPEEWDTLKRFDAYCSDSFFPKAAQDSLIRTHFFFPFVPETAPEKNVGLSVTTHMLAEGLYPVQILLGRPEGRSSWQTFVDGKNDGEDVHHKVVMEPTHITLMRQHILGLADREETSLRRQLHLFLYLEMSDTFTTTSCSATDATTWVAHVAHSLEEIIRKEALSFAALRDFPHIQISRGKPYYAAHLRSAGLLPAATEATMEAQDAALLALAERVTHWADSLSPAAARLPEAEAYAGAVTAPCCMPAFSPAADAGSGEGSAAGGECKS